MVTTKTKIIQLTDLDPDKRILAEIVAKKYLASKVSDHNEKFSSKLKVDLVSFTTLLESISSKLREAEMIFYSYLESPDHALLCGIGASLPVKIDLEFSYRTRIIRKEIEVNDRDAYRELVDMNFRHFLLLFATLYENMVTLCEILVKKVYLHLRTKAPQSTPFHDYKEFLDILINLGYRKKDYLFDCIDMQMTFLKNYLPVINSHRNRMIHGMANPLYSDTRTYKVHIDGITTTLSKTSPDLDLEAFCSKVLSESNMFFRGLFQALAKTIKPGMRTVPH